MPDRRAAKRELERIIERVWALVRGTSCRLPGAFRTVLPAVTTKAIAGTTCAHRLTGEKATFGSARRRSRAETQRMPKERGVRPCRCDHWTAPNRPRPPRPPTGRQGRASPMSTQGISFPTGPRLRSCTARWVTVRRRLRFIDERPLGPSAWSVAHSDVPTGCADGLTRRGSRVQVRMAGVSGVPA